MVRKTRIIHTHKRSYKRSTKLHRRRYGKGRKGRKCRKTMRGLRGGDIDIVLAGDVGSEQVDKAGKGMRLLKETFDRGGEEIYVKLKTSDGYESIKYKLDEILMEYIQSSYRGETAHPKITTVIMCDDSKGVTGPFSAQNFIEDYQSFKREATVESKKTSPGSSNRVLNFFKGL